MDEAAAQPHAIREMMARSRRFVVSKLETINGVEKVPYSTQGTAPAPPTRWST
jgi:hypothetical protein